MSVHESFRAILETPGYQYVTVKYRNGWYHGEVRVLGQMFRTKRTSPDALIHNLHQRVYNQLMKYQKRRNYKSWSSYGEAQWRRQVKRTQQLNHSSAKLQEHHVKKQ